MSSELQKYANNFLEKLIETTKELNFSFSIKYFNEDSECIKERKYDFSNIRNINKEEILKNLNNIKFFLNSKSEKKFFKKYNFFFNELEKLKKIYFLKKSDYYVLLKNGRILEINGTKHVLERFITRYLIFYEFFKHRKYDVSNEIRKNGKKIVEIIKNSTYEETLKNEFIISLLIKYLNNSLPLKDKSIFRLKDKYNIKRKEKIYEDEKFILRIISHPFLFLINTKGNFIKTVELFSNSFPYIDYLNKTSRQIFDSLSKEENKEQIFKKYLIEINKKKNNFIKKRNKKHAK